MALTSSQNPFFHRGSIDEGRFFAGRQKELREVFGLLGKSSSVSLVGQRKIGKSSFLHHLARPEVKARFLERPDDLVTTYLNFESLAYFSELEVLQKLLWEVHAALATHGLEVGDEYKIDLLAATPFRIIDSLGQLFRFVTREKGRRFAFLFDEFEASCANPHLSLGFFNTLRSFASNFGVAYVVATRKELFSLPIYRMGRSSPFFNYFTTVYLGLYPEEEARRLMRDLAEGTGVTLDAEEEDFVLEQAGPFPFFEQTLCWYLWERKAEQGGLEAEERERAYGQFLSQARPHYDHFWESLSPEERAAAAALAGGGAPSGPEVAALQRKALARANHGGPDLVSGSFREFVRSRSGQT